MPIDAVGRNRDFPAPDRRVPTRCPAWRSRAAQSGGLPGPRPSICRASREAAEFLGLVVARDGSPPVATRNPSARARSMPRHARAHVPVPAMAVVPRRCVGLSRLICKLKRPRGNERSVFEPPPGEQHAVGEDRRRRSGDARCQDPADVWKQKRARPPVTKISPMPSSAASLAMRCTRSRPERPPRRLGRGAHAAIVATQVAVEIGVEPEAGADRAVAKRPPRAPPRIESPNALRSASIVVLISVFRGKAAPGLEISADIRLAADDGEQVARAATAQRCNQLGQQAGRKSAPAGIDLDPRFHRHGSYYDGSVIGGAPQDCDEKLFSLGQCETVHTRRVRNHTPLASMSAKGGR